MMILDPNQPFTIDNLRTMLRQNVGLVPRILADWQHAEGLFKDVPILPPDAMIPKAFDSLKGTVRVTNTVPEANMLTLGGFLETTHNALVLSTVVISPADLEGTPDPERVDAALAAYGNTLDEVAVEIVGLVGQFDDSGKLAGVCVSRPLIMADAQALLAEAKADGTYQEGAAGHSTVIQAAELAVAHDHPIVGDHGQPVWQPIVDKAFADAWGTFFRIVRNATVGLAARSATQ